MAQQGQSRGQPTKKQLLWVGVVGGLLLLIGAVLIGYRYGITLWDWIKLLVVPVVIAGGGIWFNRQQRERELESAREQREQDTQIAESRTQDEALQAYLDQIGQLLLDKDRPLRQADEPDEVRMLARVRTLTVLRRLDGERKASVVQFLWESGVITMSDDSDDDRIVAPTPGAVHLGRADLSKVILNGALLINAGLSGTNLRGADLREANLRGADLSGADLSGADLSKAYLAGTRLGAANLSGANLSGINFTNEEVERVGAASLNGATMPNGQKYEDWLKDREGSKENGENE